MAKTTQKKSEETPETPVLTEEPALELEDENESSEIPAPEAQEAAPTSEPLKKKRGRPTIHEQAERTTVLDILADVDFTAERQIYVYAYRLLPVLNHLLAGYKKTMVNRWDVKIDEQTLKLYAGSGLYFIRCTHLNEKRERMEFLKGEVRIFDLNHPPRIPPGSWVDAPENKEWTWANELLKPAKEPEPAKIDPLVEILREQAAAQRQEIAAMRQEMRESANRKNPEEQSLLKTLLEIATRPAPAPPSPPPPIDPIAQMTAAVALIDKLRGTPEKPKDAAAELENVLKIQRQMEDQFGSRNGGRSRKTGWQEVISECTPPVAEALKPVFQIIAMGMAQAAQKGQQQANQQQQPPQQQQAPPPMIQQPTAPPIHEPPNPGPQLVEKKPTLEAIATEVLSHLQKEKTGYQLGDWYIEEFGDQEFKEVRVQGKPQLLLALKDTAEWRDIFKFSESGALDEMLTEFFTWEPPDDEDEDDDEDEAPPAANLDAINTGWTQPATVEAKQ